MTGVAIIQLEAMGGAVQSTLARLEEALNRAADSGAALLVAPELATTGYGAGRRFANLAEPVDGPTMSRLAAMVERTGVALVAGFPERAGTRVYNAAAVLRPGLPPLAYRKLQLYGDYERRCFAEAPADTLVFDLDGLKIGVLICFDVEFPEHVRRLAQAGCNLVAVPTALPAAPSSPFVAERIVPVRAFENQVFVAYAGWSGSDAEFGYAGRSCLSAPDGGDLVRAPVDGDFLGIADVEPGRYEQCVEANPYLRDLREV